MMDGMTLAQAPMRTPLTLVGSSAPQDICRRLSSLGLRRGAQVTVVQTTAGGGRVVSVAGSRIALGNGVLDQLWAEEVVA